MANSNRVTTTTNNVLMPMLVDTVLNSNVFATRMLGKPKRFNSEKLRFPIKFAKNQTTTSFSGFDTLSTSSVDNFVELNYFPKFVATTISLPKSDLSINENSEAKALDLARIQVQASSQDCADSIGTMFFADGTGNNSKDMLGLGAIVDDGTNVATIGGLSRSTYSTLQGTKTASGGTLTLLKMSTLYNAVTSGQQKPTVGITDEATFALYEQLLQPQERIMKDVPMLKGSNVGLNGNQGLIGGTGFTGLNFKGFPVLADEKCTAGYMYFLNEDFLDFYALPWKGGEAIKYRKSDIEGNDYDDLSGLGFSWTGWREAINAEALLGRVVLAGELVTDNPKRHGVLTGITGV